MRSHYLQKISLFIFSAIISLAYCFSVVLIEFKGTPISDIYSFISTAFQWLIVSACATAVIFCISSYRLLFAVLFPPLLLISLVMCYLNISTGARLTPTSIEVALINDATMWFTMINPLLIAIVSLSLILAIWIVYYRWKYVKHSSPLYVLIQFLISLLIITCPIFIRRISNPVYARLPYSIYFAPKEYIQNRKTISAIRTTFNETKAIASATPPDVVLILGESLRADHLPFNGYSRNTMPKLSMDSSIISFPNIYSEYTHTDSSLPHIMTCKDPKNRDAAYEEQSFITLFKNAGYETIWIANQELSRSYTYFAHECDSIAYCNAQRSLYTYELWLDSDTEPVLNNWLRKKQSKPKLAIIHTIGSHWWYKSHYTPKQTRFLPEATHKNLGRLSLDKIINSYDNTIIATDDFLAQVINNIKDRNVVMLFISDHGEALGENGLFLHANEAAPVHKPACMIWYSKKYADLFPTKINQMKANCMTNATTSAIFHTIIDIADIQTDAMNKDLSILHYAEN